MRRSLILVLLLCALAAPTYAQEDVAWPPDATDIFVPGIEVFEHSMLDKAQQIPLGDIVMLPEIRAIRGADGQVYEWPKEIDYFRFTYPKPIVIYDELYIYRTKGPESDVYDTWTLNLKSGEYNLYTSGEPPQTPCGQLWPKHTDWDQYVIDGQTMLCKVETGEHLDFPQGYRILREYGSYDGNPYIRTLADGRLLVAAQHTDETDMTVLVQNTSTKQFDVVGKLPAPFQGVINFETKTDNIFLIRIANAEEKVEVGIFNLSKNAFTTYAPPTGDFEGSFGVWNFWPNPTITTYKAAQNGDCTWLIYDLETNEESFFNFGDLCYSEFTSPNGTSYFRQLSPDKKTATVISFNPLTNERREIYSGEVEDIKWVSEDERYIVAVIDSTGQVDNRPKANRLFDSHNASLQFIDLQLKLKGLEFAAKVDDYSNRSWEPYVTVLSPNWIVIGRTNFTSTDEDTVIKLSSDGITIDKINIEYKTNDEWAAYSGNGVFGYYRLDDHHRIPVFYYPQPSNYYVSSFIPIGNDQFEVRVGYDTWPEESPADLQMVRFLIKIPGLNLPINKQIFQNYGVSDGDFEGP